MDVRFSAEQQALRDSVAHALERLAPRAVAQLDDAERATKLDAAVAASGWRELRTPAHDGSASAGAVEVAIVAEELGRGLADAAFLGPTLAAELRRLGGAPPADAPETVALGPRLADPAATSKSVLEPEAVAIDAGDARSAVVLVPVGDAREYELGQVPLASAGPARGVDLTRPLRSWARPPAVTPLAGATRRLQDDDVTRWRSLGLATSCADLVGAMGGALDLACDYARERRQYGVPIGSFQAVQHLLADAYALREGARSVALYAAWAVDGLDPSQALGASSVAKAYCARAARTVCETAIQVHGGIGNTWDCLAHVYLRRALLSSEVLGGVGASLDKVLVAHGVGHGMRGDDGLR